MAEYTKRRKQVAKTSPEVVIIESILTSLGSLITFIWNSLRKGNAVPTANQQARQQLRNGWAQVEQLILQSNTGVLAISEADKLLDAGLKLVGTRGESMGERLKASKTRFNPDLYHRIWEAHKLRNRCAHEMGVVVPPAEVKVAVATFHEALDLLGLL